ncbi:MAG TPA: LicD family protein [Ohtaekwangia sp.]
MASKAVLTKRNLSSAREILFTVTSLLDKNNIRYHLEGGTLLGLVRDGDLLPWDDDVDISIPEKHSSDFLKLKFELLKRGYKMSVRKSNKDVGPVQKNQYSLFKVKPILGYFLSWFMPKGNKHLVVLDIFVKVNDAHHTYWQAKEKVMRVDNKYYQSYETIQYLGKELKVPNEVESYLTEKYGNWKIPVKEWNCGINELTIYPGA